MTNTSDASPVSEGTAALQAADPSEPTPIGEGDGRSMRRKRNRDAVIRALIELIQEGDLQPTVAKIADRALVSHRSVFRYFDDLNDLARTAIETEFRNAWPLSVLQNVGEGPLEQRIHDMVEAQIRTFQRTHLLGIVARSKAIDLQEIDRGLMTIYELRMDQMQRQFAPELDAMSPERALAISTAIVGAVGLDAYDVQRRLLERTPDEIAEMWRTILHALLD